LKIVLFERLCDALEIALSASRNVHGRYGIILAKSLNLILILADEVLTSGVAFV
jgi:hypothetical protein